MDGDIMAVRSQLGETVFAEAWAAGKAMTQEQAIAYALEGRTTSIEATLSERAEVRAAASVDSLKKRELEVLRLVADGLSNREIAAQLILAPTTVKWYLSEIYGKLGVANRTQAVARAQKLNLL
jgi:ATP/maltotriose-dependent transcriptional regulator MalT